MVGKLLLKRLLYPRTLIKLKLSFIWQSHSLQPKDTLEGTWILKEPFHNCFVGQRQTFLKWIRKKTRVGRCETFVISSAELSCAALSQFNVNSPFREELHGFHMVSLSGRELLRVSQLHSLHHSAGQSLIPQDRTCCAHQLQPSRDHMTHNCSIVETLMRT